MFLWDQIIYIEKAGRRALDFALAACCQLPNAQPEGIRSHLDEILSIQQTTYIRHEIGELEDRVFDRGTWHRMLSDFPHTAVELLIRTLKDTLADTGPQGPLRHFIEQRQPAGLGFYMAFGSGLRPLLFPELKTTFDRFMDRPQWDDMAHAVQSVHHAAATCAREVMEIYATGCGNQDLPGAQQAIEGILARKGIKQ